MQYLSFHDWLISFSMSSSSTHFVAYCRISLFYFKRPNSIPLYVYFLYPSHTDGRLYWFSHLGYCERCCSEHTSAKRHLRNGRESLQTMSGKGLLSKTCKEFLQRNCKIKTSVQIKKWAKDWKDISSKKTYEWHMNSYVKGCSKSLVKCKPKPQLDITSHLSGWLKGSIGLCT